jgi:putative ABC transport system permease protein
VKYLPLVWSALWRKPIEAVLVWLAVTVAFTLFGFMVGLHAAYDQIVESARMDRLEVESRFPSASPTGILMPFAVRDQILKVNGVSAVGSYVYVRGYYRDPHQGARVIAVDEHMREAEPELPLTAAQWQQLLATPTGVFASPGLMTRLGLQVGDALPIITTPGTRADGAATWEFHVLGVVPYKPDDGRFILGNLSYVDNSRPLSEHGYAWAFRVAVSDAAQANEISLRIDRRLANSSTPTLTIPDKVNWVNAVNSGISVASKTWPVAGAGIFMILLLTANGIAQSVRERRPEFAVLKTVGFRDITLMALVFAEVAMPCLAGAAFGTGLAAFLTRLPAHYLPADLATLPKSSLSLVALTVTIGCALLLALASAVIPMRRVRCMSVTDAFAGR